MKNERRIPGGIAHYSFKSLDLKLVTRIASSPGDFQTPYAGLCEWEKLRKTLLI
jgi:hypothetical protein